MKYFSRILILIFLIVIMSACNTTTDSQTEIGDKGNSVTLFPVKIGQQYGYVNKEGDTIIEPQFDYAGDFSEEIAQVRIGNSIGYINKNGKYIISPQFNNGDNFSGGFSAVDIDGEYGYIDKKGDVIIEPQFDEAMPFSNDLAGVCLTITTDGIS